MSNFYRNISLNSFLYVSSGFADPKNSGAYLRYKGEDEEELKKLNFSKLGIMRPSFLLGNRKEKRVGEKIGIFLFKLITPLFWDLWKKWNLFTQKKLQKQWSIFLKAIFNRQYLNQMK